MTRPICRRQIQRLLVVLMVMGVVACSAVQRPSPDGAFRSASVWERVPPERAAIRFEGSEAPAVVSVRRRFDQGGGQRYEVALENDTLDFGENRVLVATRGPQRPPPMLDSEPVAFDFSPDVISQNFNLMLKGARKTSTPVVRRNRYGPYHFVVADYPGSSRCVYAWQELQQGSAPLSGTGDAKTLQFRFCDPDRSPRELIAMFERIAVDL